MITRRYQNSAGQQQEVTLSADAWEALSEEGLNELLGFKKPEPAKPANPVKSKPARGKAK
jgi:hypothetical protein